MIVVQPTEVVPGPAKASIQTEPTRCANPYSPEVLLADDLGSMRKMTHDGSLGSYLNPYTAYVGSMEGVDVWIVLKSPGGLDAESSVAVVLVMGNPEPGEVVGVGR